MSVPKHRAPNPPRPNPPRQGGHTAGPWEMTPNGIILAKSRSERQAIGIFQGMASEQQHVDEHRFNCRLIAAAPDLLGALKLLKDRWDGGKASTKDWKQIDAAIAKAEGK